jgi:transcriptional regulator of acetoin/glycerol metabolism
MNVLLTFTGFHDPYTKSLVGDEEVLGPILSLVIEKHFDHVILFSTPSTTGRTAETEKSIQQLRPATSVEVRETVLDDPTNYLAILRELRNHYREIAQAFQDTSYYISVASGTPQMHACWLLLAASGEIPAQILHTRPPRFVTKDRPSISTIDLTNPDFPIVKANLFQAARTDIAAGFDETIMQMGIVGEHPKFRKALETAGMLAQSDVPVIIFGETGTGKDVVARFIHRFSQQSDNPFVPINCAAFPENLVESILFGHVRGAFSGATTEQKGKFDQADGGTLFLDELGELPLAMQAKLLRVLQDGMVEPLGSSKGSANHRRQR